MQKQASVGDSLQCSRSSCAYWSVVTGLFGFVRVLLAVGRECAREESATSRVAAVSIENEFLFSQNVPSCRQCELTAC